MRITRARIDEAVPPDGDARLPSRSRTNALLKDMALARQAGAAERPVAERALDMVSVADFGAIGDDATDDTDALQRALDHVAVGEGVGLWFPPARGYRVGRRPLVLQDARRFVIHGNMAAIRRADALAWGGEESWQMLRFIRCHDFAVRDLVLDGNREPIGVGGGEWGHAVHIVGCRRFRLDGVRAIGSQGDGFALNADLDHGHHDPESFNHDGLLLDCTADRNYRQGISIINAWGLRIIGGHFRGTRGTEPESGIHIEANEGTAVPGNRDILVMGAEVSGNAGWGIAVDARGTPEDVRIVSCRIHSNGEGAFVAGSDGFTLEGCDIAHYRSGWRGIVDIQASEAIRGGRVLGNRIRDIAGQVPHAIYVHGANPGPHLIEGNLIEVEATTGAPVALRGREVVFRGNDVRIGPGGPETIVSVMGGAAVEGNRIAASGGLVQGRVAIWVWGEPGASVIGNRIRDIAADGVIRGDADVAVHRVQDNTVELARPVPGARALRLDGPVAVESGNLALGFEP